MNLCTVLGPRQLYNKVNASLFEPKHLFMDHCECKYVGLLVLDEYAYIAQLLQLAQEIHSLL